MIFDSLFDSSIWFHSLHQYYKKIVKDWVEQWSITAKSSIASTFCYNMEFLLVAYVDRHLMKLIDDSDTSPPRFDVVAQFDM